MKSLEVVLPCKTKCTWVPEPTTLRMHLVDYASVVLADTILLPEERNYPKLTPQVPSLVSGKYIVIPVNYSSKLKEFKPEKAHSIVRWCISNKIVPVLVGSSYHIHIHNGVYSKIDSQYGNVEIGVVDLRDKTDILQLHSLIDNAIAVVGADSGVLHLAGMTDTPIVAIYTHKDPRYLMPIRHDELGWNVYPIVPDSGCKFCMSSKVLCSQDFTQCASNTLECVDNWSVDKVIDILNKIVNKKGS
jgi:ADP-heptose:LPS heptosyltransferase